MGTGKLELKDIAGYFPYGLNIQTSVYGIIKVSQFCDNGCAIDWIWRNIESGMKPILRPLSDLYRTITHNGKEIVPIDSKIINDFLKGYSQYDILNIGLPVTCFDYLHELKIDYRGLIDAGLAIDVNTIENNPYK